MNRGTPIVVVDDDDAHHDLIVLLLGVVAPRSAITSVAPEDADELGDLAPFGATILLDRRLGIRDSLDLIRPLRRARPDLAVAVMSAFVTPEDRAACLAAGATAVFQKPGDLNGWRSTLRALIAPDDRPEARAA